MCIMVRSRSGESVVPPVGDEIRAMRCDAADEVIGIPTATHSHWVNSISVWRTKRE